MPPSTGRVGPISYATRSKPGRMVAGDLFEVVGVGDGRVAVFLGDVAGKGVGAAVLMAAAQTQLRMSLKYLRPLSEAIAELNREVLVRAPVGEFISLFVGLIDAKQGTMEFVDAGHGYWVHRAAGGEPRRVEYEGDLVLGVEAEHVYHTESIKLSPGDRIVIFSDGVVEQHAPSGELFGFPSVLSTLAGTETERDDVQVLLEDVMAFAQSDELSDDVTIASIRFDPTGV